MGDRVSFFWQKVNTPPSMNSSGLQIQAQFVKTRFFSPSHRAKTLGLYAVLMCGKNAKLSTRLDLHWVCSSNPCAKLNHVAWQWVCSTKPCQNLNLVRYVRVCTSARIAIHHLLVKIQLSHGVKLWIVVFFPLGMLNPEVSYLGGCCFLFDGFAWICEGCVFLKCKSHNKNTTRVWADEKMAQPQVWHPRLGFLSFCFFQHGIPHFLWKDRENGHFLRKGCRFPITF